MKLFQLNGWHTVVIQVFHSKATLSIDNKPRQKATFKKSPPPVDLDQPMRIGFMGRRVLSARQAFKGEDKTTYSSNRDCLSLIYLILLLNVTYLLTQYSTRRQFKSRLLTTHSCSSYVQW